MKQHRILKVFVTMAMILFSCIYGYSYVMGNGAGGSYGTGSGNGTTAGICGQFNDIEYYIMLAGGYYLDANSQVQQLLKTIEWQDIQGVDYPKLKTQVDSALFNLNTAAYITDILIDTAKSTPYNDASLTLLKNFSYDSLAKEYALDGCIFASVRQYLQGGDITGVFQYTRKQYDGMIRLLDAIKKDTDNYRLPDLAPVRHLNEAMAQASTFGSYVARVFSAIR